MSVVIPNCLKYDRNDPSICSECDGYLIFDKITQRCECEIGTGEACGPDLSCSQQQRKCVPINQCLDINLCKECRKDDHSSCNKCDTGYFVSPEGNSCITLSTCKKIKKCKACDIEFPEQCSTCQSDLSPSSDGMLCECVVDSGEYCPSGLVCSPISRRCSEKNECKSTIENCKYCIPDDQAECKTCFTGFTLDGGQCVSEYEESVCIELVTNCSACDSKNPSKCTECENGLSPSEDGLKCECTARSGLECHGDQICSSHYHICIENQACLSFPSMIKGCEYCSIADPRFCYSCQKGLVLSEDQLHCVRPDICKNIYGCEECNSLQPDLCFKCEKSLTLSKDGLACQCGGQMCYGDCVQGRCQTLTQNKTSPGQITGIVIVVVLLLGVIIVLTVLIIFYKRKVSQMTLSLSNSSVANMETNCINLSESIFSKPSYAYVQEQETMI